MDIIKYDVYRGPNLGVYTSVNDNVVLLPMGFAESKAEKLAKYLEAKPLFTSVANSIQEPLKGMILAEYNLVPFVCLL